MGRRYGRHHKKSSGGAPRPSLTQQFAGAALIRFLESPAPDHETRPAPVPAPIRIRPFPVPQGAVVTFDAAFRYTSVTHEAATLLGTTPAHLLGHVVWELFDGFEQTPLGRLMHDVAEHRCPGEIRTRTTQPGREIIAQVAPTSDGGIRLLFRFVTRVPVAPRADVAAPPQRMTGTH